MNDTIALFWSKDILAHTSFFSERLNELSGTITGRVVQYILKDEHSVATLSADVVSACQKYDACLHAIGQLVYDHRLLGNRSPRQVAEILGWNESFMKLYCKFVLKL